MASDGRVELGRTTKHEQPQEIDNSSTTTSSNGVMTPSEDLSDVGSVVTEIDSNRGGSITRHSLQLCDNITSSFLSLVRTLQDNFGSAPGWARVGSEDVERLHEAYNDLAVKLMHGLGAPTPFRKNYDHSAQAATSSAATYRDLRELESQNLKIADLDCDTDIEAILDSMDPEPTENDIMKLVFHWTIFTEFEGFKREDVMTT